MDEASAALQARLAPYIGVTGPRQWSARPIEASAILNFLEAVEDGNPVYWDEEFARASRFGRTIAPPHAIFALAMPAFWLPDWLKARGAAQAASTPPCPLVTARAILADHGFSTVTVVNREEEYFAPFGPGDGRIGIEPRIVSVSAIKQTKVGPGVFYTFDLDYRTERDDQLVARARSIYLLYNGAGGAA